MAVSPLHFFNAIQHPRRDTATFGLGRAIHSAVLEPADFASSVICDIGRTTKAWELFEELIDTEQEPEVVDVGTRNAKAYKEAAAQHPVVLLAKEWDAIQPLLEAVREGRGIITRSEYEKASAIAAQVRKHPEVSRLLTDGESELPIEWTDEATGVEMAGRVDYLTDLVIDIKSTARINPRKLGFAVADLFYPEQLAAYCDGTGRERGALIFVESETPYDVFPWMCPDEVLAAARKRYRGWLELVRECRRTGVWPGVSPDGFIDLDLPLRAYGDDEDIDFEGTGAAA